MVRTGRRTVRALSRSPWFFGAAFGSVALGIGACTAVFAVINALFLRPLPFRAPHRLVEVYATADPTSREPADMLAGDRFRLWPALAFRSLEALATESQRSFQMEAARSDADGHAPLMGAAVSGLWFEVLGVGAERGRTLGPEDDLPGAPEAVVVSHELWAHDFAPRRSALGSTVRLSGRPYTLVGVMPRSFQGGRWVWVARNSLPEPPAGGRAIARLREGSTLGQAMLEVGGVAAGEVAADSVRYGGRGATLVPMGQVAQRRARASVWLVLGAVVAVFLLAISNLTSLFLVRAADRAHPMAIRAALGAGRWDLGSEVMSEVGAIGVLGTAGGLLLARWSQGFVTRSLGLGPGNPMPIFDVRVLAFAGGLLALTLVAVGLEPMRRSYRLRVQDTLKGGSMALTLGPGQRRVRAAMLAVQVGVALFLVTTSATISMAVRAYRAIDVGYSADRVVVAEADYGSVGIGRDHQGVLSEELRDALSKEPAIAAATRWQIYSIEFPPRDEHQLVLDRAPDLAGAGVGPRGAVYRVYGVGRDFFETLEIPLLRGRALGPTEGQGDPAVAVITEDAARTWWPGEEALGRRFRLGRNGPWRTVVGICANTGELWDLGRFWTLRPDAMRIQVYLPYDQMLPSPEGWHPGRGTEFNQNVTVAARAGGGTSQVVRLLDTAIRSRVPSVRMIEIGTMLDGQMDSFGGANLLLSRLVATLSASAALLLSLLGVMGVVGESVTRRTREIGIRRALGARAHQILLHVSREGLIAAAAGGFFGFAAYWLVRTGLDRVVFPGTLRSLGISTTDWRTVVGGATLLILAVCGTSLAVARRAARIDPGTALTSE